MNSMEVLLMVSRVFNFINHLLASWCCISDFVNVPVMAFISGFGFYISLYKHNREAAVICIPRFNIYDLPGLYDIGLINTDRMFV